MNDDPIKDSPSNDAMREVVALIQGMSEQLSALQIKVDERLYDTRPLWESVQSQIDDLRADLELGFRESRADMERGFQELRVESKADIDKLRTELTRELRHLSNKLDVVVGNIVRLDAIQRDIESRIRDIESNAS